MAQVLIHADTRYPVNRKVVRRAITDTLYRFKVGDFAQVSVAIVGQRKMKQLARNFLGDEVEHEVLAFPQEDPKAQKAAFIQVPDGVLHLGDVVLCWPQVLEGAAKDGILVDEETYRLVSHGVEHLLGKHHEDTN